MTTDNQKREPPPKCRIVDTREPEELRTKLMELGWEQRSLECGDYWFFDNTYKKIGIERKEIGDFISSLGDRLSNQLERCLDHYDTVILLLEGNWKQATYDNKIITSRGVTYNTWAMAWNFIRAQQHKGVTIELTINHGHTIKRLNELYAWYQKGLHTGGLSHTTFTDDRIMAFPRGCRGKTAIEALKVFKSLACIGNAEVIDLINIPGVAKKKAQTIYDHFNSWRGEKEDMEAEAEQKIEEINNTDGEKQIKLL
jgi:ERCC4-type nuclease